jgi:uncharacterized membrane protein
MSLRSLRERWLQVGAYELVGLAVVAPLYGVFFDGGASEGAVLIIALFLPEVGWSVVHNWLFDRAEWRFFHRVASDRPHCWRIIHAASHEVTAAIVTLPVIMVVTGHGLSQALIIDIWLGLCYGIYAYLFHIVYDRLRPVPAPVVLTVLQGEAAHLARAPGRGSPADKRGAGAAEQQFGHNALQRRREDKAGLVIDPGFQPFAGMREPPYPRIGRIGWPGEVGIVDRGDLLRQQIPQRIEQDVGFGAGRRPAERSLRSGTRALDFDRDEMGALQLDGAQHRGAGIAGGMQVEGQRMGNGLDREKREHERGKAMGLRRHPGLGRGG